MPTILSHPAVLFALRPAFRLPSSIYIAGAICACIPDLDVIGFSFGIRYGDLLGHRGLTHSIFFAAMLSAACALLIFKNERWKTFAFLFVCTASHGFLDAFTDGGLGVAFFSPCSNHRYFFPWRPLIVSPIGIADFLTAPAAAVLGAEFIFIWIPCLMIFLIGRRFFKK